MARRGKRQADDFDDSFEVSYFSKRSKTHTTQAEKDEEEAKAERLRQKKLRRKERKKVTAEERRKEEKATAQQRKKKAAELLDEKQSDRKEPKKRQEPKKKRKEERDGLVKARKGVQYKDVEVGEGPEVRKGKQIQVRYTLRDMPDGAGRVIDSSSNFGTRLGKGEVVVGWDIGLEGMRQGGTRQVTVPPQAGYGQKDIGAGKGAMLYFEIKLLAC